MRTLAAVALLSAAVGACATRDAANDGGLDAAPERPLTDAADVELKVWELDFLPWDRPTVDLPPPRDRDAPRCPAANAALCACVDGAEGLQVCEDDGTWARCECARHEPPTPLPPRLVAPLHARMVSSQRPTLRWVLPAGIARARVELCDDRPCTRRVTGAEVSGTSWRPAERLRPGVVFWRVTGLRADGASAWTSATWEFGVRHRDSEVDTTLGTFKDFNGDTYDDLVVVSFAGTASQPRPVQFEVFFGGPEGVSMSRRALVRSTVSRSGLTPVSLATGDIDGDGLADLLTAAAEMDGSTVVFYGSRDGVLRRGPTLTRQGPSGQPTGAALGDFNGDGFDDAFLGEGGAGFCGAALHLGGPTGLPVDPSVDGLLDCEDQRASPEIPTPIAAGDFSGDGYADFFAWAPRVLNLRYGNPGASIEQREPAYRYLTYVGYGGMWAADVNSDGATDVFAAPPANVFYSHGGMLSARTSLYAYEPPPGWIIEHKAGRPGDLNGDGRLDFPVVEYCDDIVPEDTDIGRRETCRVGHFVLHLGDAGGANRMPVARIERVAYRSPIGSPGDLDGDGVDELARGGDDGVSILQLDAMSVWQPRGSIASVEGGVRAVY